VQEVGTEDIAAGDTTTAGHRYRWVVFFAMVGVYVAFGITMSSIPPMITEVRDDLGIGRGAMGLALGAWTFLYIFTASAAGSVVDRIGIRWSLFFGGLSLVLSGWARSFAEGTVSLWFSVAIMGLGGPLISAAAPTLCGQWFTQKRERETAVSTYNLGPGIGSLATIFLTNSVLLPWLGDWRTVVRFESAIALGLLLIWVVVAIRAPEAPAPPPVRTKVSMMQTRMELLRSADVRDMLVLGALTFFVGHSMGNWIVDAVATRANLSDEQSANWITGAGVTGMLLLFVLPRLVDRFGRPNLLIASWTAVILGLFLIGVGSPRLVIVGVFVAAGRSVLVALMIMSVMAASGVNASNMGAANGLWFAAAQVGAVIGPPLVGVIADSAAGFGGAMFLLMAVGAVAIVVIQLRVRSSTSSGTA